MTHSPWKSFRRELWSQGPIKGFTDLCPRFLLREGTIGSFSLETGLSVGEGDQVWRPPFAGSPGPPRAKPRPRTAARAGGAGVPAPGAQLGRSRSGLESLLPFFRPFLPPSSAERAIYCEYLQLHALAPGFRGARSLRNLGRSEPAWGWGRWRVRRGPGCVCGRRARLGPRSPALPAWSRQWSRLQRTGTVCTHQAGGWGLRAPRP